MCSAHPSSRHGARLMPSQAPGATRAPYFVKLNSAVLVPRLPLLNAIVRRRQVLAQLFSVFHT